MLHEYKHYYHYYYYLLSMQIFNAVWLSLKKTKKKQERKPGNSSQYKAGARWVSWSESQTTFQLRLGKTESRMCFPTTIYASSTRFYCLHCVQLKSVVCVCDQLRLLQSLPLAEERICCLVHCRPKRCADWRQTWKPAEPYLHEPFADSTSTGFVILPKDLTNVNNM